MPVNRAVIIQLSLLLLVVPLQFVITQWRPVNDTERSFNLNKLLIKVETWKNKLLSVRTWKQWYDNSVQHVSGMFQKTSPSKQPYASSLVEDNEDDGESPAVEVLEFKDQSGHFGQSIVPRSPRSPKVKYRVGQVIRHKIWGYRGVIVGWDETAKAPEDWIKEMHGSQKHWRNMPSYSVMVDTKDRPEFQTTYVVEDNIEIVRNTKIAHPDVDVYFEKFDGTRYLARPWLKKMYPHDQ